MCASGSWGRGDDPRDGRGGVLGVLAQARGDLVDACSAEEAEGGIAEEGHDGRALPGVEGAPVLAERHVLDAVQLVLDGPVAVLEREQALRGPGLEREAGDAVEQRLFGRPCSRQVRSSLKTCARPGQSR